MFFDWVKDFTEAEIGRDYPLKGFTTIGTGGIAEYFILPKTVKDFKDLLFACEKFSVKPYILGRGSNMLFSDGKISGAVISTLSINAIKSDGDTVTAFAGAKLCDLIAFLKKKGYCGFDGLIGIPSTVGGAVVMNASAFGCCISDFLVGVTVADGKDEKVYLKKDCNFSYRKSVFLSRDFTRKKCAVISVDFRFPKAGDGYIDQTEKYKKIRKDTQPCGKTFGSVFRNGKDYKAGELLEGANLKGFRMGGAGFSDKHANFIINFGEATSKDIFALIKIAKERVFNKYGVKLKEEVRFAGDF